MFGRKFVPLSKKALVSGQPAMFPVYDKNGQLLLKKGELLNEFCIKSLNENQELFTLLQDFRTATSQSNEREKDAAYHLPSPQKRLTSVENLLTEVYQSPTHSSSLSKLLAVTSRLKMICEKSPDASIAKIILDDNKNYTVRHAIHTAILSCLTALHLEWEEEDIRAIISAALTMNLSLGFMQDALVDQQEPLSQEQQEKIKQHPEESAKLLRHMGVKNPLWIDCVLKHHECLDGSGYPNAISNDQMPSAAIIISLSDIYCAKVSGRGYRHPIFANIAAKDIYLVENQLSRGTLIEVFVKLLGLYPPGCFVRLASDEVGVVVKRGERVDSPVVQLLNWKDKENFISTTLRDTAQRSFSVKTIIPPQQVVTAMDYDLIWKN